MPTNAPSIPFDFTDLRLFLHVLEAGSITLGAQHSCLALASASARMRGLEEATGVTLLQRHRSGVTPTKAGLAFAHHARLVLQQMQQMHHELRDHAQGVAGVVRLLCNTAAITEYLPPALAPLLVRFPALDVDLQEHPSHTIVSRLMANAADLGLVADSVDVAPLEWRPWRDDRLTVITGRQHALARRRQVSFVEALGHAFVGLGDDSALQQHLNLQATQAGRRLHCRLRLRNFDAVGAMVAVGVGIAIVPVVTADRLAHTLKLRSVALTDTWASRRLLLCARQFSGLSAPALQLASALLNQSMSEVAVLNL